MGGPFNVGSSQLTTVISIGAIFFLIVVQMMQAKGWIPLYRYQEGREWPLPLRWAMRMAARVMTKTAHYV